jgi:nicotinamidase-related amidase
MTSSLTIMSVQQYQYHTHELYCQQVSSYDELKIRDGPLYSLSAPERNESNECLLEYEQQQLRLQELQQAGASNSGVTITSNTKETDINNAFSGTTLTSELEDYFAPHKPSPLKAETTALLIVDVQPEYWSHCPAVRKDFPEFPQRLANTIDICRKRRAKIIWVRADYRYSHSPWLLQFERIRRHRNLGEVPCDPNSPEFTWEDFATPQGAEVIITKSSWSSTSNTALMDILRVAGIETVLVCGLITSVCVQHSAFGIFEAGYRTLLVTDACADRGKARHEAALALYGDYMYELITSEDLESEQSGLIPAKPLWLLLDSKARVVRPNSFPIGQSSADGASFEQAPPPATVVVQAADTVSNRDKVPSMPLNMVISKSLSSSSSSSSSTTSTASNSTADYHEESTVLPIHSQRQHLQDVSIIRVV